MANDVPVIANALLTAIPNLGGSFGERNRRALEAWRDGNPDLVELGLLLEAWSRNYLAGLAPEQQAALVEAIAWLIRAGATEPDKVAQFAVRAASCLPARLPWQDPDLLVAFEALVRSLGASVRGANRSSVGQALTRLLDSAALPELVRPALLAAQGLLQGGGSPPRLGITDPVSAARVPSPPPAPSLSTAIDPNAVCDALEHLLPHYLQPRMRQENMATIAAARSGPVNTALLSSLRLLSWLAFARLDGQTRSDVFRVPAEDATDFDVIASFMQGQVPSPGLNAARTAAPFILWFRAQRALDSKRASPREVYLWTVNGRRMGVLDSDDKAYLGLLRLGNTYLERLKRSNDLDANSVAEWLEVYSDVLTQYPAIKTAGPTRQLLQEASDLARPFGGDQRVAFLLTAIDPRAFKHPWTRAEVFPFLTSEECETLDKDMKSLRLKNIRTFLASPEVQSKLRQYLIESLADPAYDEFQAPIRSIEGFRRPDRPSVERVREALQRVRPHERWKIRLLREWYAYAKTSIGDIMGAKELWEEVLREDRSYEVRWNLAVVYVRIGQIRYALETLWEPGLRNSDAPYEHLRFAASLALGGDSEADRQASWRDLYRRLPSAAAQAYVYSLDPPANDPDGEMQQLNLVNELATAPVEASLASYRNAATLSYDDLVRSLTPIKNRLLDLRLKSTWRTWLSGYINRFPSASALWEALSEAWAMDDRTRGKAILEEGIHALRNPRGRSEQYGLIGLLRRYLPLLTEEELKRERPQLQQSARPVEGLLREKAPAVYRRIWPEEQKEAIPANPWKVMDALLKRGSDEEKLRKAVADCAAELATRAPDAQVDIGRWREALDRLLTLRRDVRREGADSGEVAEFNDWLVRNPPSACSGLLQGFKKLAEFVHGSFAELVRDTKLGPELGIEAWPSDPGIARPTGISVSACVRVTNPAATRIDRLRVGARRSQAVIPLKDRTPAVRLDGGGETALSVPLEIAPGHDGDDPLLVPVASTYSWGVVEGLERTVELAVPRFEFGDYLAQHGVVQDHLPKIFEYDTDLRGELLSRLFVGRDAELEYVRRSFSGGPVGTPPGTPIYYHGIRRVGKTSLLRRIAEPDVLSADKYLTVYVSLFGLQPTDPLVAGCRMIRDRVLRAVVDVSAASGCPVVEPGEDYQVLEDFQAVAGWWRKVAEPRVPMVLIDEFHNLVTPQAAPLLDLLRRLYQEGEVRFIFAGWKDHEILREESRASHLWPLTQRPINFLSVAEADALVRRQLALIGVGLPSGTLEYAMSLTAGHPNLLQKLFQLVVEELDANRRPTVTISDIESAAHELVEDRAQFTTSWFNRDIISAEEEAATKEIIDRLEEPGGWVALDSRLSEATRRDYVLPLIAKDVLSYEQERRRVRIKGLLLERFLRSVRDISRFEPADGRDNVALFVDYENIVRLFPDGTSPATIASALAGYVERLGNPVVRIVAANWRPDDARVKNAFTAQKFSVIDPLRTQGRGGAMRSRRDDKDVADAAITRMLYDRMLDEREGANDRIDVYIVASGDGRYLEYIKDFVENKHRRCRLLARVGHPHLSRDYLLFETARREVAAIPGHDPVPDFVIDDLGELIEASPA